MSGTDTIADVGPRFDVLIDGYGYVFPNPLLTNLPFRSQRAAYSYTPTFIERTNVSGNYGDNQQDFFMTASQDDWSGGQGQHFLRTNDVASSSKFYLGGFINTRTEGQVTLSALTTNVNDGNGGKAQAACGCGTGVGGNFNAIEHAYCVGTDLWTMNGVTATDIGAHGAGTVAQWGMCADGKYVYVSGGTKLRKWDGAAFTDFSVTVCSSIAFLNNTLYGFTAGKLVQYSTAGAQSDVFPWKYAEGTADATTGVKLIPFGPTLLILFPFRADRPELWLYDGTNTSMIAEFPRSAKAYDCIEIAGIVFVSALITDDSAIGTPGARAAIYAYVNGTVEEVWRSVGAVTGGIDKVALGTFGGNLIFVDPYTRTLNQLDVVSGAVTGVASYTHGVESGGGSGQTPQISSASQSVMVTWQRAVSASGVGPDVYPSTNAFAASGTIQTSLVDFDNGLTKNMRSVKVDWSGGGSVDIAYQLDSLTGSYTSLQTAAVSGTEYLLPAGTQGHSISVQITLNNSAGNVPTLKRIYVRAAPVQQSYRKCQYVLDLTGRNDRDVNQPVRLRDGTDSTLTGAQMAANLIAAITSTAPISITDRFGTYNAVFEQGEGITEIDEIRPDEFYAQITSRGI